MPPGVSSDRRDRAGSVQWLITPYQPRGPSVYAALGLAHEPSSPTPLSSHTNKPPLARRRPHRDDSCPNPTIRAPPRPHLPSYRSSSTPPTPTHLPPPSTPTLRLPYLPSSLPPLSAHHSQHTHHSSPATPPLSLHTTTDPPTIHLPVYSFTPRPAARPNPDPQPPSRPAACRH